MAAMSEIARAVEVGSLTDLPTEQVRNLYSHGHRMWLRSPLGSDDELYYARMIMLTSEEMQTRTDPIAKNWQDSFAQ